MVNNTGVVVGDDGDLLLVDTTSTEARTRALLDACATLSDRHARLLVNTHHHGDHTFGNWMLPPTTTVVGHARCRDEVLAAGFLAAQVLAGPDYGRQELRPPDLTFDDRLVLHAGGRRVELIHLGPAHTTNDVVVWLPEERVLFAGDLCFAGGQPFLVEGSVAGYREALAGIRALRPAVLVPGHGPVQRGTEVPALLDDLDAYAAFVTGVAQDAHRAGRTPLQAALAHRDNPFATWQETERLVGNLHRAYAELDGAPLARLDLTAIWPEMTTFHGGPIPCHA
ncbi:MBL fold metallo-hydrolase [Pseudonocardia broussonetiae]|uniref:MBL fold metallo-hydrolase n=2 Tax=Pseudonocardia broussonetiae TaxID=2736640 RepID=A0A6M6JWL7_9PSEU|nr:MBL fold metallo-hydrolase [Pseudonocardia broussonetiae]